MKCIILFLLAFLVNWECCFGQGWVVEFHMSTYISPCGNPTRYDLHVGTSYVGSGPTTFPPSNVFVSGTGQVGKITADLHLQCVDNDGTFSVGVVGTTDGVSFPRICHGAEQIALNASDGRVQKVSYLGLSFWPQLSITSQSCPELTLSTNCLYRNAKWEISDNPINNFQTVGGNSSSISLTESEISTVGLDAYGILYARVSDSLPGRDQ